MTFKRHSAAVFAISVLVMALAATAAFGASSHFVKGGSPVCTDIGKQLQCTAELAGLGGGDVVANVSANGSATNITCVSPGGNAAPGQNPVLPVSASGSQTITNPKNGRASISVATDQPTITAQQAGCPNNNWQVTYSDVSFTTYTLTISQSGSVLYTCTGSFGSGSQNGQTSTPSC
ncbi:MAG: hypothetical protein ACJ757_18530 [Gaiellaceae bacterium]